MTAVLAALRAAREWAWAIGLIVGGVALALLRDQWRRDAVQDRESEAMDANLDAIRDAQRARRGVDAGPDGLREDDGYRRD